MSDDTISDVPEFNISDVGVTWEDLYIGTYATGLINVFLLLALFAESVSSIKHRETRYGFWAATWMHILLMIIGLICYNPTVYNSAGATNFLNILWAFFSAIEHCAISFLLLNRVVASLRDMKKWMSHAVYGLVGLVFVFTLMDQLYWAVGYMTDPLADYLPAFMYLNSIYMPVLDVFLFSIILHRLHKNSKILNTSGSTNTRISFTTALAIAQFARFLVFLGIEVVGLAYGIYPYITPTTVVLVYTILKPIRPFIIITDMERVKALERAGSNRPKGQEEKLEVYSTNSRPKFTKKSSALDEHLPSSSH
ncbi:hypothetical protein HDU85_002957 [Gaertneriomyces sp. JEL0708]|nr:hypothetical protein HDU85_002957 [Gaertneriomyces sp. JEL0708]